MAGSLLWMGVPHGVGAFEHEDCAVPGVEFGGDEDTFPVFDLFGFSGGSTYTQSINDDLAAVMVINAA